MIIVYKWSRLHVLTYITTAYNYVTVFAKTCFFMCKIRLLWSLKLHTYKISNINYIFLSEIFHICSVARNILKHREILSVSCDSFNFSWKMYKGTLSAHIDSVWLSKFFYDMKFPGICSWIWGIWLWSEWVCNGASLHCIITSYQIRVPCYTKLK